MGDTIVTFYQHFDLIIKNLNSLGEDFKTLSETVMLSFQTLKLALIQENISLYALLH